MDDIGDLDARFREFREQVRQMADESAREADVHLREDEEALEVPFHDGETGSFELALGYLDETAKQGEPISANSLEETYINLLLSYKRMKGNVSALERVIRTMQSDFDLPSEEEMAQKH